MPGQPNHLVVVVPGIGGSQLVDPAEPEATQTVWYGGLGAITAAVGNPAALDIDRPLRAVGLVHRFVVVPWFKSIDGYDQTWATVTGTFPGARTDPGDPRAVRRDALIVAFPYDFRRGVADAAEGLEASLRPRIETLGERTTIVVVAHSMGGLVARRWASHHDAGRRCRGIVTLGSPFRGAPKALDVVANGLYWGRRGLQRRALSRVVQRWPSLYDLVPTDDRVVDKTGALCGAWELGDLPGWARIGAARDQQVETRRWWLDQSQAGSAPALVVVAGNGHATSAQASWDGRRLRLSRQPLAGEPEGDGTVPAWAAIPPEWRGPRATEATHPCGDQHGAICHTGGLRERLLLLNHADPGATRGAGGGPFLGFDTDSMVEPGDTVVGALRFQGQSVPLSEEASVTARLVDQTGGEHLLAVEGGEGGEGSTFAVALPAGVEGIVELAGKAELPGGRQRVAEAVVVLGAEDDQAVA